MSRWRGGRVSRDVDSMQGGITDITASADTRFVRERDIWIESAWIFLWQIVHGENRWAVLIRD